jgi:hypothetical protein
MIPAVSKSAHVLELARELLDDIELSRLAAEAVLLKASRLARLAGTEEDQEWLRFELVGYDSSETSKKYMYLTGRWIDVEKKQAYWGPLAQQDTSLEALKQRLAAFTTQGIGGEGVANAVLRITNETARIVSQISAISAVRSRVLGLLHQFASRIYYERVFGQLAQSIFEDFQNNVDRLLAPIAGEVLSRLPAAYERLAVGDPEAISHALTTCRRVIDAFSDALYPPSEGAHDLDGASLKVGPEHHKNRLNLYIAAKVASVGRRDRLRKTLNSIYERVSAGVHSDVSLDEARALVLGTYSLLGEIACLGAGN